MHLQDFCSSIVDMEKFGPYIRKLRKQRGLTLKQVEKAAHVSNSFLSQVERGVRNPPKPDILNRLASAYSVPAQDLMEAAGYIKGKSDEMRERERVDLAYEHVITDPNYSQGTRIKGQTLSFEAKKLIVRLYQKATGRNILKEDKP